MEAKDGEGAAAAEDQIASNEDGYEKKLSTEQNVTTI